MGYTTSSGATRSGASSSGATRSGIPTSSATRSGASSSGDTRSDVPSSSATRSGTPSSSATISSLRATEKEIRNEVKDILLQDLVDKKTREIALEVARNGVAIARLQKDVLVLKTSTEQRLKALEDKIKAGLGAPSKKIDEIETLLKSVVREVEDMGKKIEYMGKENNYNEERIRALERSLGY